MWKLTLKIAGSGNKTSKVFNLSAVDYASAVAAKDALLASFGNVSDSAVQQWTLSEVQGLSSSYAAVGTQIEQRAALAIDVGAGKLAYSFIPAPNPAIFEALTGIGANIVDTANPQLQSYFADLASYTTISDGETPALLVSGKRTTVKNSRG